jgi:drug/metabolite transporter (DMT)-like permease
MSAVVLALVAAVLFGAMAATLGAAFQRSSDAEAGALVTGLVALAVTAALSLNAVSGSGAVWPFLLTGLIAPGGSQLLYVMAVREVGASRAAVIAGAGPLVAVTIAFTILGEPVEAALVVGALLIVLGVVALAGERDRPEHLRFVGLVLALGSTVFFATRDNIVRWLADDTTVDPQLAAAATIVSGSAVMAAYLLFLRGRRMPGGEPSVPSPSQACSGASRTPRSSRRSTVDG